MFTLLNGKLTKSKKFTGTVTLTGGTGTCIGEMSISSMTGYDATAWSNRKAWSASATFAADSRYAGAVHLRSSDTVISVNAVNAGNYSVELQVIY